VGGSGWCPLSVAKNNARQRSVQELEGVCVCCPKCMATRNERECPHAVKGVCVVGRKCGQVGGGGGRPWQNVCVWACVAAGVQVPEVHWECGVGGGVSQRSCGSGRR